MNVYVDNIGHSSLSISRVVSAFKDYSPSSIEVVDSQEKADLVLLHVYGRITRVRQKIELLKKQNKKYAVMQYTLRHSLSPSTSDWKDIWEGSEEVWSYLNIPEMVKQDGEIINFNFYYAPLGVDTRKFYPLEKDHFYQICTTGLNYMTEGVRECVLASRDVGRRSAHFGIRINHSSVDSYTGVDDKTFTSILNKCDYTAGLRRGEGFELTAAEGLVCGIRPILFDAPHYHAWYDGLGIFVRETGRESLIEDLKTIFKGELKPVLGNEIKDAQERFNWEKLIAGFWSNI